MQDTVREFRATVRRIEYIGRRYAVIEAQCSPDFVYSPGQFTKVAFVDRDGIFERYYSIASVSRGDGSFELCLILDDERTRQLVADWKPGSTFPCSPPAGRFTVPPRDRPIVCIAGGSGITPLKAIIEDRLGRTQAATVLLYGCQSDAEIPFFDELTALARKHKTFEPHFFADYTKLNRTDKGRPLDQLERFVKADADYLLCGPPPFMEAARRLLLELGVAPEAIHQDRY